MLTWPCRTGRKDKQLSAVAEGIETEKSARLLDSLGVEMLQGYWICEPKPLHELQAWMKVERNASSLEQLR